MNPVHSSPTQITYYDLDYRGKLKLSALLRIVHIAADKNASDLGAGYGHLSPLHMSFVLQRFGADIIRLPEYNETVTVRTWAASVTSGVFTRKGDMYGENGQKLMDWESLWVLFDIGARKILKVSSLPVALVCADIPGVTAKARKIMPAGTGGRPFSRYTHTVRYSEVDTNRHMNNSIYGDLVGNALFMADNPAAECIRKLQINFLAETRLGEEVDINCTVTNEEGKNKFLVIGHAGEKTTFTAEVES